jgi:anthranilate synthase/aminodeoxychorismate synthase-like glutamine amidotransferase
MILLIDNYDSFTYNLVPRLGEIDAGLDLQVFRNDQLSTDDVDRLHPSHLIISPGPCTPSEAGISCACIERFSGTMPILGVCLGHQAIGQATGGTIVRAKRLMHGKVDRIFHNGRDLFAGQPNPFEATRYHSLVIQPDTLSPDYEVTAWADAPDGGREIMGVRHKQHPTFGLQFHPESFLTQGGTEILRQFLNVQMNIGGGRSKTMTPRSL